MKAVLEAGASMINDVDALTAPGAMEAVANSRCAVCLMARRRTRHDAAIPTTMTWCARYAIPEEPRACGRAAGIAAERITVDPGFGFGKTAAHNLTLQEFGGPLRPADRGGALAQVHTRPDHRASRGGPPGRESGDGLCSRCRPVLQYFVSTTLKKHAT